MIAFLYTGYFKICVISIIVCISHHTQFAYCIGLQSNRTGKTLPLPSTQHSRPTSLPGQPGQTSYPGKFKRRSPPAGGEKGKPTARARPRAPVRQRPQRVGQELPVFAKRPGSAKQRQHTEKKCIRTTNHECTRNHCVGTTNGIRNHGKGIWQGND